MKYLKILVKIYSARLGKDLINPGYIVISTLGAQVFFWSHLVSFGVLISKVHFQGWSPNDLWSLLFVFEIFTYLGFYLLHQGNHKSFQDIHNGKFDFLLTKPISTRFITFCRGGGMSNLISAGLGLVLLVRHQFMTSSPSLVSVFAFILFMLTGIWIQHCISLLLVSLNFKYGRIASTSAIPWQLQELWKYPSTSYSSYSFTSKLFLLPVSLMVSLPAVTILSKSLDLEYYFFYLFFLFIVSIGSHIVWHKSLRHYTSVSS